VLTKLIMRQISQEIYMNLDGLVRCMVIHLVQQRYFVSREAIYKLHYCLTHFTLLFIECGKMIYVLEGVLVFCE
jgi:hypothetical protein